VFDFFFFDLGYEHVAVCMAVELSTQERTIREQMFMTCLV
jgi:hypothetical protein